MNEPHPPRRVLRSIGALLAGFVMVVVLSIGTDVALRAAGVFPPWGHSMTDALAGGPVGLTLSIVGAVTTWNRGPDFGPHCYPLALVATAMPCAWAGGRLAGRRA
jgi:hypothetical protein